MNKKFIKISFGILIFVLIVALGFKFILKDKILLNDSRNDLYEDAQPTIKYEDFEEEENLYRIVISIKNNTEYYASIRDMTLQFIYNRNSGDASKIMDNNTLYFEGFDIGEREFYRDYDINGNNENYSPYLDPYEERKYAFEISKGITFDEDVFDTNTMDISYSVDYFRYRTSPTSVFGGVMGSGGSQRIEKKK